MTVAELLTASRASHTEYRKLAAKGKKPDGWQALLWDALTLRRQADEADPQHLDPSWSEDKAPHADLMVFYCRQLGLDKETITCPLGSPRGDRGRERQLGLQSAGGVDDGRPR